MYDIDSKLNRFERKFMKDFTKEKAVEWLKTLNQAHAATITLIQCGFWSMNNLHVFNDILQESGKIIDLKSREKLMQKGKPITPFPDEKMRSFSELGAELDALIRKLNEDLP